MATQDILVNLDLNQNELQNAVEQNLATAPSNPKIGQKYYNTATQNLMIYKSDGWHVVGGLNNTVTGLTYDDSDGTLSLTTGYIIPTTSEFNSKIELDDISATAPITYNNTTGIISASYDNTPTVNSDNLVKSGAIKTALDNKVDANSAITAATHTKITYDSKGLVTAGTELSASDIPDISATYIATSRIGQANGVASLDQDGLIPTSQLPSYVDDVIDSYVVSGATPLSAGWLSKTSGGSALTPETDKIYVVLSDGQYLNKIYRWSGTTYVEISSSPAQATESQAGIAEIATQAEVNTGTDDQRFVTPLKLQTKLNGYVINASNPALTTSGGVCTWTISNTIGSANVAVFVRETSTGDVVIPAINITTSNVTIKINSSIDIPASTYTAAILGL